VTSVLDGRVVLVTGAARGIGAATARAVAAAGARVALLGLEPERLAALAAELGPRHAWYECDVTDREAVERAVGATVETLGGIDVVVANAGIANHGTVAVTPARDLTRTIEVNLIGVVHTVAAALPHVTERRGYLLLVSSAAAFTAMPGMAAYCASKAGVEQFGNVLRLELAHLGVGIGTAHPIWIDTDMVRGFTSDLPSFREVRKKLPWPLSKEITVSDCATMMLRGIQKRKRRVYVPRSIGLVQAMRSIVNSPLSDAIIKRTSRRGAMIEQMEDDVRKLGRSFGSHSVG